MPGARQRGKSLTGIGINSAANIAFRPKARIPLSHCAKKATMTALNIISSSKSIWKEWHDDRTGRQPQGRRPHRLSRTREQTPRPQLAIATKPGRDCDKVTKRTGYIVRIELSNFDSPNRSTAQNR